MKKNILASFLLFAMALVGCTSYDEPTIKNDKEAVYLNFNTSLSSPEQDASPENSTRRVAWKMEDLGNNGLSAAQIRTGDAPETDFPAIVVIKNRPAQGNAQKIYYISTTFYRRGQLLTIGENNPQGLTNAVLDKDIYGADIRLNRADEWYMMVYFGERWDKDNKRMRYDPYLNDGKRNDTNQINRPTVTARDRNDALLTRGIDQPMILSWVKMTLKSGSDGKLIFSPENESVTRSVKTMGTLMTLTIKNRSGGGLYVYRVGLRSNVLSTKGYYSLDDTDLPAINTDPLAIADPVWYPEDMVDSNTGFYYTPNMLMVRGGQVSFAALDPGRDYNRYPVLWGMPVSNGTTSPTKTEINVQVGITRVTDLNYIPEGKKKIVFTSNLEPRKNFSLGVEAIIR